MNHKISILSVLCFESVVKYPLYKMYSLHIFDPTINKEQYETYFFDTCTFIIINARLW